MAKAEMQGRETAHRQADDVRLVDLERVEHRTDVVARAILLRLPQRLHLRIMEAVVVCGGLGFLWRAWR